MPKGPGGVIVFGGPFLSGEPPVKRAVAFFDGQNLFYSVRSAFGYTFPNYDVVALATAVCATRGWRLDQVRFYTGVPNSADNAQWSAFWAAKLLRMSRQGVVTFKRPLRSSMRVHSRPACPGASHKGPHLAERPGPNVGWNTLTERVAPQGPHLSSKTEEATW
jgi:hypothetical protein